MISDLDRVTAVELINEARENGARLRSAYDELNISERTYQRWTKEGDVKKDQRPLAERPTPKNKLTNDNPYSESLFKTMKYRPKYPFKGFPSLEEARKWVEKFVKWYNYTHLHSGINFITPYQRHNGLDKKIMEKRKEIYEKAKAKHPERWSKNIRNWTLPKYVSLNPISEGEVKNLIKEKSD